jgi:hypothetical protein
MMQDRGLGGLRAPGAPRVAVGALCVGLIAWAARHRGHSVESMDVRTYAQMIRGVADHGLPFWDNGPVDRFPALVVPWGVPAHGHIWGIYGALYAYLAAPAFLLGSLPAVSVFTFALLAPLALFTFLLARRLVRNEWYAVLAAAMAVFSTPVLAKAMEITAYPLATVIPPLAAYFSLRSLDARAAPRRSAVLSGVCWGAGSATHPLLFPMALAAFAMTAVAPGWPDGASLRERALRRLGPTMAGFALVVVPTAALNWTRFGSPNPISYGPVPWTGVVNPLLAKVSTGAELVYAAPFGLYVAVVCGGLFLARGRNLWTVAVLASALALLIYLPTLRARVVRLSVMAYAYIADLTLVDMGPPYDRAPDGIGRMFGNYVVKSTLQCTPALILAPLAVRIPRVRWPVAILLAASAALFAALLIRADMPDPDAVGWPWVYIRYTLPALPLLVVSTVVVLEEMRPTVVDAFVALAAAAVLGVRLRHATVETEVSHRVALVVVPLALAEAAFVGAAVARLGAERAPQIVRAFAFLALGIGFAIGTGNDYRINADIKSGCDGLVDQVAAATPERFGLVGVLGQFDVILSLAAMRDVQYADLLRVPDFASIRPLIDYWRSDRRPVYLFSYTPPPTVWPDVSYRPVDGVGGLYLVDFQGP